MDVLYPFWSPLSRRTPDERGPAGRLRRGSAGADPSSKLRLLLEGADQRPRLRMARMDSDAVAADSERLELSQKADPCAGDECLEVPYRAIVGKAGAQGGEG